VGGRASDLRRPPVCTIAAEAEILDFVRRIIDILFTARIAVDARRLREGRMRPPVERLFVNPLDRPDTQGVPP
jgi:hypothetical protein